MKRLILIALLLVAALSAVPVTLALLYPQPHSWDMVGRVLTVKFTAAAVLIALYACYALCEHAVKRRLIPRRAP